MTHFNPSLNPLVWVNQLLRFSSGCLTASFEGDVKLDFKRRTSPELKMLGALTCKGQSEHCPACPRKPKSTIHKIKG